MLRDNDVNPALSVVWENKEWIKTTPLSNGTPYVEAFLLKTTLINLARWLQKFERNQNSFHE